MDNNNNLFLSESVVAWLFSHQQQIPIARGKIRSKRNPLLCSFPEEFP